MDSDLQPTSVAVAVVGAGPNGVSIAHLLGLYGIDTVVIEKSLEVVDYPRAVGMDDEALRLYQGVGMADALLKDMVQNVPLRMFRADGECFAEIRPSTREFGWYRRNIFMQPVAERTLRAGLSSYPKVQLCLGEEVQALQQDANGVRLDTLDTHGRRRRIHADYVVAADGGRSHLRSMLGVNLVGKTHPMKWLVVDVRHADVDAPYTALNCDPGRPNVCIHLPNGYRRWEFMVLPNEDEADMMRQETVHRLIRLYVAQVEHVEVIRARVYTHNSRVADRFVVGRVALIGDAAHLTPPWVGQGLNAGLRDAGNLAWKLAGIVRGQFKPEVLATYEQERHAHAQAMIDLADRFGAILMPTQPVKAWLRDLFFSMASLVPGLRDWVVQMRFKPMPHYTQGMVVATSGSDGAGRMLIQPDVELAAGLRSKLDEVLGPWFAVVGWQQDPQKVLTREDLEVWRRLGAHFVQINRSRSGAAGATSVLQSGTVQVEDVDNLFADWIATYHGSMLVVRPDRYVAAQASVSQMPEVAERFCSFMS